MLAGVSLVFAVLSLSFSYGRLAPWYEYLWTMWWMGVGLGSNWFSYKSGFGHHPLRYPFALWLASTAFLLCGGAKPLVSGRWFGCLIFASPFLLIAAISLTRLAAGKPQIEVPNNIVHSFKRLEWRWLTKPKWDFWFCWIGLLFSPVLATAFVGGNWNNATGSVWLLILRTTWVVLMVVFAYRWVMAPIRRNRYKETVGVSVLLRVLSFVYYFSLDLHVANLVERIWLFAAACGLTVLFDNAFSRCHERLTPAGIGEYEALEGPSLGL